MAESEKINLQFGGTTVEARRTINAAGNVKINISKPDEEKVMEKEYHIDMNVVKAWQKASASMVVAMQKILVDDVVNTPSLASRSIVCGLGDYSTEVELVPHRAKQAAVPHDGSYTDQYGFTSVTTQRIISDFKATSETQINVAKAIEKAVAHLAKGVVAEKEAAYKAKQAA